MNLKNRVKKFLDELGLPLTRFAQKTGLTVFSYYKWFNGELKFSDETEQRIDNFLKSFNR